MFRKITKDDHDEFIQMSREFYASDAVLYNIPDDYHETAFRELMRSEDYLICFFFEQDDHIAGYALLNKSFSHEVGGVLIWIEELYVRPSDQEKGIGSAFLDWIKAEEPAARYRLETEPDNLRAAKLYQKHGYCVLPYSQLFSE